MKRIIVLIVLIALGGVSVNAQRPVGDTLTLGSNNEYLYDALFLSTGGTAGYNPTLSFTVPPSPHNTYTDFTWGGYSGTILWSLFGGELNLITLRQLYPELFAGTCIHIIGEEFATTDDLMVLGLAVCPTIYTDSISTITHVIDTSIANRLTEYVQLYTINGSTPQLEAQGAWRWEDPHRYMLFPNTNYEGVGVQVGTTTCVPLYETMFDTSVFIDAEKTEKYMLAGTHNNNGVVWADTCYDTIFPTPQICIEHYATAYSSYMSASMPISGQTYWSKYGSYAWHTGSTNRLIDINIFPILDTLFGTPCAALTGLDTVEVDSLWATLMWSADARQHDWQVWYRPTGDTLDNDAVVTVAVPTVTLTGLVPGTEYSVAVRGRCDIDNYSPWSDTLLFTTPQDTVQVIDTTIQDTTQVIDTTIVDTTVTQGIRTLGSLDRFTRIMPNPASEVVNVLSSYRLESVAVYDLTGRLLLEQPAEGISAVVKVGVLPRGTYIMAIRTLQGVATKKLVVGN